MKLSGELGKQPTSRSEQADVEYTAKQDTSTQGSVEGHPLWSFGETLKEKAVEKARAAEEARSIFSARRDLPTLYGYVAALEQRIEVLERLIELLKRR